MIWYFLGGLIGIFFYKKKYNLSFWKAVWYGFVLAFGLYFAFGAVSAALILFMGLEEYSGTSFFGLLFFVLLALGSYGILKGLKDHSNEEINEIEKIKTYISNNNKNLNQTNKYFQSGDIIETNLVGVTFEGRQKQLKMLKIGEPIILNREPNNEHDENAIGVTSENGLSLGYVNRGLAKQLSPIIDKEIYRGVIKGEISSIYKIENDPPIIGAKITFKLPRNE